MSRSSHSDRPVDTIYFELSLHDPKSDLLTREINQLRFAVARSLRELPVTVRAWTVLPNRMLCIWTLPKHDADYAKRWHLIKLRFSRALAGDADGQEAGLCDDQGIWQMPMLARPVRDPHVLDLCIRRCYIAPAEAGLVADPALWEYSSFHKARYAA